MPSTEVSILSLVTIQPPLLCFTSSFSLRKETFGSVPTNTKHPATGRSGDFAGLDVLKDELLDYAFAFDGLDDGVPNRDDLRVSERLVDRVAVGLSTRRGGG